MNDVFIEKIVPRKKSGTDYLKILGIILAYLVLLAVTFLILARYIFFLVPLIIFGGAWLAYIFITNLNIEHEYIVTNGDLDVDAIYAKRKRKRVFAGKAKEFEICAPVASDEYKNYRKNRDLEVLDASSNTDQPNTWFLVAPNKGKRTLLLFEPDERMMEALRRHNPSRIRYNPAIGVNA